MVGPLPHLAILSLVNGPRQKLQQGQQEAQAQAQAQEEEEALQVVRLERLRGGGPVRTHTAAGPPLVPQVLQLTGLTQLENGNGEVLNEWGTWRGTCGGVEGRKGGRTFSFRPCNVSLIT